MSAIFDKVSVSSLHRGRPNARAGQLDTPSKSERTRAAILSQALSFLREQQFRDLSVSQLMAPLDIGRSTFYQYFADLHELMETLLRDLEEEVLAVVNPWLNDEPDPVDALRVSIASMVDACYAQGPILRAVRDAASTDPWLDAAWNEFLGRFDDAVEARIKLDQRRGRIAEFDARAVAVALNRMDADTFITAFGSPERKPKGPVLEAMTRIWLSTLYPGWDGMSGAESTNKTETGDENI